MTILRIQENELLNAFGDQLIDASKVVFAETRQDGDGDGSNPVHLFFDSGLGRTFAPKDTKDFLNKLQQAMET